MSVFCKFTTLVLKNTDKHICGFDYGGLMFLNVFSTWKENAAILAFCLWQAQIEDLNSGKPETVNQPHLKKPHLPVRSDFLFFKGSLQ